MTKTIKNFKNITNFNNITKLKTKIGIFNRTKKKKYSIKRFIDKNRNLNKILKDLIKKLEINQEHIEFFIDDGQAGGNRETANPNKRSIPTSRYAPLPPNPKKTKKNQAPAAEESPAAESVSASEDEEGEFVEIKKNLNSNIPNQINNTKKGLILTSNVNRKNVSHSTEKQGIINSYTSNKSIKTKLQNTKRFKVGFIKIFPGRLASKYLKVIGHLNLVIIDSGSQTIYHYEPKKKGVMLSLEKKLRFKMGEKQIKERLNGIAPENGFYDYNYVKIHGNQGSFNQYCSLYSIYGALKFARNLDEFYKSIISLRSRLDNGLKREYNSGAELIIEKQTNKFIEKILKSIKQKNVRQLLKFYIDEVIEKDRDKASN